MSVKSDADSKSSSEAKLERIIKRKNRRIKTLYSLLVVTLILAIAGGVVGYMKYSSLKNDNKKLSNPEESAKLETQRLTDELSKLVDLPKDEQPTIATVTDISKLKDQTFFSKAENGDKLFVYNKAKKAILYRPSTQKIVEIGPISSNDTSPEKQDGVNSATENKTTTTDSPATTPAVP